MKLADTAGKAPLAALRALAAANADAPGCSPVTPATEAVCTRMQAAAWETVPPLPTMVVGKATAADGTRPTYTIRADGMALVPNPARVPAGAPCDFARARFATATGDYGTVNAAPAVPLLALCVRK